MKAARRPITEVSQRIHVPTWVRRVFTGITVTGVLGAILVFAVLYREAGHGQLTVDAAAALFVVSYLAITTVGVALFMKLALPPVYAQADELERTLAQQLEINRRQRDFLEHLHHELRTPVTVVVGATQLLAAHRDGLSPDQVDQLREAAARNAAVLGALVEDLMAGVDEALPGLTADGHVNNWSSARSARRVRITDTGPMGGTDAG